ncbi:MAG: dipeptidase [Parachlamydiales bacterium]|nr:dipeptidase [Parachlamydiales bacterium]
MLDKLEKWYSTNKTKILKDFFDLLRFKTISADENNLDEMLLCAKWLDERFKKIGFQSEIIKTSHYPLVFAEKIFNKDYETILIYAHYDVQPIEPLEEWNTDPFEPTIKEGKVYARGASDDKGQLFYILLAIEALLELKVDLKVNIKIILDGEEESSSQGLIDSLDSLKEKLKADHLLVVDMFIPEENTPAITLGARGLSAMSVDLKGSSSDLHSGDHGGLAYNPLRACVELLSKLYDENGKVAVKGFYDDVIELDEKEKSNFDLDFFDLQNYKKTFGIKDIGGEKKFRGIEANWLRPTVEINGIGGGYFEKGFKTVIPARVVIKISSRLVPNQDPEKIFHLVKDFLEKNIAKAIDMKIEYKGGGKAIRSNPSSSLAKTAEKGFAEVFKKPCKKILSGGSIPVIGKIVEKLNCPVVLIGVALSTDNIHAPNEHFGLDRFEKGFLTCSNILTILGREK